MIECIVIVVYLESDLTDVPSLRQRVESFIERGATPSGLYLLLLECVADASIEALVCVQRLYEDMYGGFTFNVELKAPAASALLVWKDEGLKAVVEGATRTPTYKNISIAIELLAAVAARGELPVLGRVYHPEVAAAIKEAMASAPDLSWNARARLTSFVLSIPDEEDATGYVANAMSTFSSNEESVKRELFAAMARRMLAVSAPVLDTFEEFIRNQPDNEPAFQDFLTKHPQILDPLAIRIWPQPNLFGFKEPDYVVQRADGTYMVVEIECPGKPLVTQTGQLTAHVTHAETQATDYRRYLIQRFSEVEKHLPNFQEPDCLVVVGLSRGLNAQQRQVLHDANNNRTHMRIVGFDWLLDRARTIAGNMVQPEVEVRQLRVV